MTPKEKALQSYYDALDSDAPDWRAVAESFAKLHKPRATKPKKRKGKYWFRNKCRYPFPRYVAEFADGTTVGPISVFSPKGKPLDWKRAIKICQRSWRMINLPEKVQIEACYHPERFPTPEIVGLIEETTNNALESLAIAAE